VAGPRELAYVAQPFVSAGTKVIASPFQFATDDNDNLQIVSANSLTGVALAIHGRRLTAQGQIEPFAFVHTPNTDRSTRTENYKLGAGALLNLTIFATSGSPSIGQTYVSARIIRGLAGPIIVLGTLLGGYVTAVQHLAYPGSPIQSSIEGGGYYRIITGTDPATGVRWSETVPTGARWRLVALRVGLTTGAGGPTRIPSIVYRSGGVNYFRSISSIGFGASAGGTAYWAAGMPLATAVSTFDAINGLPDGAILLAGTSIVDETSGFQPVDDFSGLIYAVQEWLEVNT
jgi:hypothetical protein